MALAQTLNTNEIKDASGLEVEMQRLTSSPSVFAKIGEQPSLQYRMSISHQESGTGLAKRRRSVIRFDKNVLGNVDVTKTYRNSAYVVLDRGIGQENNDAEAKNVLANLMSFLATTGAASTVLFDCTGTGASNLISQGS